MNNSLNSLRIQARVGICRFSNVIACSQFAFALRQQQTQSLLSPWKVPNNQSITFNCFLRLTVPSQPKNDKCDLILYSRTKSEIQTMGKVSLNYLSSSCEKVRKYQIKDSQSNEVAIVQVSIFIKNVEFSLPQIEINSHTELSANCNYSAISKHEQSLDFGSILGQLKLQGVSSDRDYPSTNKSIQSEKDSQIQIYAKLQSNSEKTIKKKYLVITQQISIKCEGQKSGVKQTQNVLIKLFQEINKRQQEIGQTKAKLDERQAQIKHIKMKQLRMEVDQTKTRRLKKRMQFFITANDIIINGKDQHFENQYQELEKQKKQLQEELIQIGSQNSLKLFCLKKQLQKLAKTIQIKDHKISSLLTQIQSYVRQINELKLMNKQKTLIIYNLRHQLALMDNKQTKTSFFHCNSQVTLGKKQDQDKQKKNGEQHNQILAECNTIKKIVQLPFGRSASNTSLKQKKSRALSLFNVENMGKKSTKNQSKSRFSLSKFSNQQIMQIPNLADFLMSFGNENTNQ